MNIGDSIIVNDCFQTGYIYQLEVSAGDDFAPDFRPFFSPKEMLEMGVFEGKYCNDCIDEFPENWFENARIGERPDPKLNYFGVKSRQPLSHWQQKGWIFDRTPEGGFNGIAAIIWGGVFQRPMQSRSNVGKHSPVTLVKFVPIAIRGTYTVAHDNGRRCCNGHMIQ